MKKILFSLLGLFVFVVCIRASSFKPSLSFMGSPLNLNGYSIVGSTYIYMYSNVDASTLLISMKTPGSSWGYGLGIDATASFFGLGIWSNAGTEIASFENGGLSLGQAYAVLDAPSNGLIVQGNVGIGSFTPATKLHISSGVVTIDGTPSGFIVANSSIGVRTATPAYPLDVVGNVNIYSAAGASYRINTGEAMRDTNADRSVLTIGTDFNAVAIAKTTTLSGNSGVVASTFTAIANGYYSNISTNSVMSSFVSISTAMANGGEMPLKICDGKAGSFEVMAGTSCIRGTFTAAAAVTLCANGTADGSTTNDNANSLIAYDGGTYVVIENRKGTVTALPIFIWLTWQN